MKTYDFSKVKLLPSGKGLLGVFKMENIISGSNFEKNLNISNSLSPHPDLLKALESYKRCLTDVFGFDDDSVTVTGVNFSGADEKRVVIVTGKFETATGAVVGFSTPQLHYSGSDYTFQKDLWDMEKKVMEEATLYFGFNKSSQLTMNFETSAGDPPTKETEEENPEEENPEEENPFQEEIGDTYQVAIGQ